MAAMDDARTDLHSYSTWASDYDSTNYCFHKQQTLLCFHRAPAGGVSFKGTLEIKVDC